MKKQPDQIISAKLEVVVMPNGEIVCLGGHIGWFEKYGKYLSDPKDMTGQPIEEDENA